MSGDCPIGPGTAFRLRFDYRHAAFSAARKKRSSHFHGTTDGDDGRLRPPRAPYGTSARWLGLALGGSAGARTAQRLGLVVSGDTLLRHLRRMPLAQKPTPIAPRVLGMDDWAWRKGQHSGTILCDLERRCVMDLLPDRQSSTVTEWLRDPVPPEVISRDRAGAYAEAARQGAPHAVQVADRFHLSRNLREALEHVLARNGPLLEEAFRQSTPVPVTQSPDRAFDLNPDPLSTAQPRAAPTAIGTLPNWNATNK